MIQKNIVLAFSLKSVELFGIMRDWFQIDPELFKSPISSSTTNFISTEKHILFVS